MIETLRQPIVILLADVPIHFLLGFRGQIASQPTKERTRRCSGFIRLGGVNPVWNDITFLPEANWIRPQEKAGEPNASELVSAMRTVTMIPNRVVDGADHRPDGN